MNDYGDTPDLSHEQRRLVSAILTGNLKSFPANPATPDSDTQIDVATLIPWLRAQRYIDLADGLEGSTKTLTTHSTGRTVAQLRLAGLLAIGGSANQVAGRGWKFTGIKELVATEKAAGKPRSDEKTIRRDLKSAAQEERDAKSAGATANWHAVKP